MDIRTFQRPDHSPKIRILTLQAYAALACEALWQCFWPATAAIAGFIGLAWIGLFDALPLWLHGIVLAASIAGIAALGFIGTRTFQWPRWRQALRRLELDNDLAHRPLTMAGDKPVDPAHSGLWALHRQRSHPSTEFLRVRLPMVDIARRDPRAFRFLAILLLAIGAVIAGPDRGPRFAAALVPTLGAGVADDYRLDAWITPPDYTSFPPVLLTDAGRDVGAGSYAIPTGSTLTVRFSGSDRAPDLSIGSVDFPVPAVGDAVFETSIALERSGLITVSHRGDAFGAWPVDIVADEPPTIVFSKPPARTNRSALRLDYETADDYGVASVTATITPVDGTAVNVDTPIAIDLPIPGLTPTTAEHTSFHDLTAHPWAGLDVVIALAATDAAGQTGLSDPFSMVLPERIFNHPIARAIVEERRRLMQDYAANRRPVAGRLTELSSRPSAFFGDIVAFLAMRMTAARLFFDEDTLHALSVSDLMWQTALRIEEGEAAIAERNLREAADALAEALADPDTPVEVLEQLMAELQTMLDDYLDALQRDMLERLARGEMEPTTSPPDTRQIDRQGLDEMLNQMREMFQSGSRDQAQQMLSELRDLLESLDQQQAGADEQSYAEAMRLLEELQALTQEQENLLDQSFARSRGQPGDRGQDSQEPSSEDMADAARQEALRRALGELMRRLGDMSGDIPAPLGSAEQSMRSATDALEQGNPGDATGPQGDAVEALRQAGRNLVEQLSEQARGLGSMGLSPYGFGEPPDDRDPLGRPLPNAGWNDGDEVRVPDTEGVKRARQILDELRRRAGDPTRPETEQEYLDRLLDRF